jgi:hypothetical protein
MATVEEKLDFLLKEVKAVQANQIKVMGVLTAWSKGADLLATELHDDIQDLKSRMQRLEAISTAPTFSAPPREEEGRAKCHRVETSHQGADAGALDPITPWSRVRLLSRNHVFNSIFQSLVTRRSNLARFRV